MLVKYSQRAANTDAFAIISEGWNELVQESMSLEGQGVCPVGKDDEVLYAVSKQGDIVGVVTWTTDVDLAAFVVTLAYVEPSSRRSGVFKALMAALCQSAKTAGISRVRIQSVAENSAFQAVMRHLEIPASLVAYDVAIPLSAT